MQVSIFNNSLLADLKKEGEDFEFYPTSNEVINVLKKDIGSMRFARSAKFLDIGAGNGKILDNFKDDFKCFGIEKSQILSTILQEEFVLLGTDFMEQTLLDKKMDVIYSNPPYSLYAQWSKKIIMESYSKLVYLLIPSRWVENKELLACIENRGF